MWTRVRGQELTGSPAEAARARVPSVLQVVEENEPCQKRTAFGFLLVSKNDDKTLKPKGLLSDSQRSPERGRRCCSGSDRTAAAGGAPLVPVRSAGALAGAPPLPGLSVLFACDPPCSSPHPPLRLSTASSEPRTQSQPALCTAQLLLPLGFLPAHMLTAGITAVCTHARVLSSDACKKQSIDISCCSSGAGLPWVFRRRKRRKRRGKKCRWQKEKQHQCQGWPGQRREGTLLRTLCTVGRDPNSSGS